jgi:hypothetical protein
MPMIKRSTLDALWIAATLLIFVFCFVAIVSTARASWVLIPGDTNDTRLHGCGSSWTICAARRNNRANPSTANHRSGCDALCQAKCDATSRNPAACYVKWDRLNRTEQARECENSLTGRGNPQACK